MSSAGLCARGRSTEGAHLLFEAQDAQVLNCAQFRFLAGAAPRELTPMQRLHLLLCRACSHEYRQLRYMDQRIHEVLSCDPVLQKPGTTGHLQ